MFWWQNNAATEKKKPPTESYRFGQNAFAESGYDNVQTVFDSLDVRRVYFYFTEGGS